MGSGAFLMTEPGQEKASRTGVTLLLRRRRGGGRRDW